MSIKRSTRSKFWVIKEVIWNCKSYCVQSVFFWIFLILHDWHLFCNVHILFTIYSHPWKNFLPEYCLRIISYIVNPSWMFHCYLNSMTWKGELSTYSTRASWIFFRLCSQMQTKRRKINTDIVSSSCYQESNASLLDCYDAKCQNGTWK